ncbi:MAG: flagellar export chaperone FliS [Nitrospira sp.]|nr:flagellar export chaperone FliS [Candidatus Brocadiales bacterium]MBL7050084.1 flagellar export chaperone FliS [Nitrospira sp.]
MNTFAQYRESEMSSASPEKTVLMLFDGGIRFLKKAVSEVAENNIPEKAILIEKTAKIIEYLQSCLDLEKGGEIAENLERLYHYMLIRLTEANLRNDVAKMEQVIELLSTVREGWSGICNTGPSASVSTAGHQGQPYAAGAQQTKKLAIKV